MPTRVVLGAILIVTSFAAFAQTPPSAVTDLQSLSRLEAGRACGERKRNILGGLRSMMFREIVAYRDPADFKRRLSSDMELAEAQELIRACANPDHRLLTEVDYRACLRKEFGDAPPASAESVLALLKLANCTK